MRTSNDDAAVLRITDGGKGCFIHVIFRVSILAWAVTGFFTVASAQDQAAVEAGEALYDEHCAMCHGENLRSAGAIPDLRQLREDQRAYFDQTVTDGKGQMPTWGGILGEQELGQLWAYIRAHAR